MPPPVSQLASDFLETPYRVEIGANTVVKHVGQNSIHVSEILKVPILLALVKGESREGVIIYARTRRRAGWVATRTEKARSFGRSRARKPFTGTTTSSPSSVFADGEIPVLVATDVAARGLHIPAIRTVINYDLPVSVEEYVHRVGRAGHGGGFGESFTLVSPTRRGSLASFPIGCRKQGRCHRATRMRTVASTHRPRAHRTHASWNQGAPSVQAEAGSSQRSCFGPRRLRRYRRFQAPFIPVRIGWIKQEGLRFLRGQVRCTWQGRTPYSKAATDRQEREAGWRCSSDQEGLIQLAGIAGIRNCTTR